MARAVETRYGVGLLFQCSMAVQAYVQRFFPEQCNSVGCMGPMACQTSARDKGHVNIFFAEFRLVMAGIAEVGGVGYKQLGFVRGMGIMASGTSHSDRGMDGLFRKQGFVVTVETEVGLLGGKASFNGVLHLVRDVACVYSRMAGWAAHVNRRMLNFFAYKVCMAHQAVDFLGMGLTKE
jgi:hypothetical protein